MLDIEELKPQIVQALMPLKPDKIILFGSYAYGNPTDESDIDLFLFKDIDKTITRDTKIMAQLSVRKLISKYKIGFDFIVASEAFVKSREDYFYKKDILENGVVIYE